MTSVAKLRPTSRPLRAPYLASALVLATALSASAVAQTNARTGLGEWFDRNVADRVTVTGFRRIAYHTRTVSGDTDAFEVGEYGGRGLDRFTDFGQVRIDGSKVFGVANFALNIQDSRFQDPQAERLSLDYERAGWTVNLGDVRGRLAPENRFARFDKALTGVQVAYRTKTFEARALRSEVRGQPRTVTLQGANSPGPYYLQSSQILRGTESIEVDGVRQRFGEDYTIDYEVGSVTFVNRATLQGRIIPPTSTIVATYEVIGVTGQRGSVEGASVGVDLGRVGRLGVAVMRQDAGGSVRDSTRLEKFFGFGPPSIPYTLQFAPADTATVVIRVNGVFQRQDVDYRFDPDNAAIFYFNRFMPATDQIDVLYTPKAVETVASDREVFGLSYRLPLGVRGSIDYSRAFGRQIGGTSGTAQGVDGRYRTGALELTGSLREVPRGYVSVETVGFSRNERAAELGATYRPGSKWEYQARWSNSSIQAGSEEAPSSVRSTRALASVSFTPTGGGSPWRLSHTRSQGRTSRGPSTIDTTALGTSTRVGKFNGRLDLSRQAADGTTTVNGRTDRRRVDLATLGFRGGYAASREWSLDGSLGFSRVATAEESGLGRDVQLGAVYRRGETFAFRADYADSDAGKLATLGFDSTSGSGFGDGGFSGGSGSQAFVGATNAQSLALSLEFTPTDRLGMRARAQRFRTQGPVSSNSETDSLSIGGTYRAGDALTLDAGIDYSTIRFIDSPSRANATTLSLLAEGRFSRRLTYQFGFSSLLTGGSGEFRQDTWDTRFDLSYALADRHNLGFSFSTGLGTGYQAQQRTDVSFGYQYRIWQSLAFNMSYRFLDVRSRDPLVQSGSYSSRGLDFELAFNFGR